MHCRTRNRMSICLSVTPLLLSSRSLPPPLRVCPPVPPVRPPILPCTHPCPGSAAVRRAIIAVGGPDRHALSSHIAQTGRERERGAAAPLLHFGFRPPLLSSPILSMAVARDHGQGRRRWRRRHSTTGPSEGTRKRERHV